MNKEYVPFGKEWERSIMKMKKTDIVDLLKTTLQSLQKNKRKTILGMDIIEIEGFQGLCILTNEQLKRLGTRIRNEADDKMFLKGR